MIFSLRDRRRLQVALNLNRLELRDGSDLANRMARVEEDDLEFGTTVAAEILDNLAKLEALEDVLSESYLDGTAAAAQTTIRVDEYSESLGFGSASGRTLGSGYQERQQQYIQAIQRDLGYNTGALGGRIPVM